MSGIGPFRPCLPAKGGDMKWNHNEVLAWFACLCFCVAYAQDSWAIAFLGVCLIMVALFIEPEELLHGVAVRLDQAARRTVRRFLVQYKEWRARRRNPPRVPCSSIGPGPEPTFMREQPLTRHRLATARLSRQPKEVPHQ